MLLFKTHEDQVLIDDPKRRQNERFWSMFARLYAQIREGGYTPKQTRDIICDYIGCKHTAYYTYLREARERGIVTETHADTQALRVTPAKAELPVVVPESDGPRDVIHGSPQWMIDGHMHTAVDEIRMGSARGIPLNTLGGFAIKAVPKDAPVENPDTMEGCVGVAEPIMFDLEPKPSFLRKMSARFRALFKALK